MWSVSGYETSTVVGGNTDATETEGVRESMSNDHFGLIHFLWNSCETCSIHQLGLRPMHLLSIPFQFINAPPWDCWSLFGPAPNVTGPDPLHQPTPPALYFLYYCFLFYFILFSLIISMLFFILILFCALLTL